MYIHTASSHHNEFLKSPTNQSVLWSSFKEIHVITLFRQKSPHLMWRNGKPDPNHNYIGLFRDVFYSEQRILISKPSNCFVISADFLRYRPSISN